MKTHQIIITIVGAMLSAGLTTSSSFWPDLNGIFAAGSALVIAVVAYVTSKKEE